jgi:hypothetical protein
MAPIEHLRNAQTCTDGSRVLARTERFLARDEKFPAMDCRKVLAMHHDNHALKAQKLQQTGEMHELP